MPTKCQDSDPPLGGVLYARLYGSYSNSEMGVLIDVCSNETLLPD
jgi:hypothetical protein